MDVVNSVHLVIQVCEITGSGGCGVKRKMKRHQGLKILGMHNSDVGRAEIPVYYTEA